MSLGKKAQIIAHLYSHTAVFWSLNHTFIFAFDIKIWFVSDTVPFNYFIQFCDRIKWKCLPRISSSDKLNFSFFRKIQLFFSPFCRVFRFNALRMQSSGTLLSDAIVHLPTRCDRAAVLTRTIRVERRAASQPGIWWSNARSLSQSLSLIAQGMKKGTSQNGFGSPNWRPSVPYSFLFFSSC